MLDEGPNVGTSPLSSESTAALEPHGLNIGPSQGRAGQDLCSSLTSGPTQEPPGLTEAVAQQLEANWEPALGCRDGDEQHPGPGPEKIMVLPFESNMSPSLLILLPSTNNLGFLICKSIKEPVTSSLAADGGS